MRRMRRLIIGDEPVEEERFPEVYILELGSGFPDQEVLRGLKEAGRREGGGGGGAAFGEVFGGGNFRKDRQDVTVDLN